MDYSPITELIGMPGRPLLPLLATFLLGLMRIAPIVSLAPFFGSKLPGAVKMGLAVTLTLFMLPSLAMNTKSVLGMNMLFISYSVKELLLGVIMAILTVVPFYVAQSAGTLIDYLRGSSSLMVQDPTMRTQVSPIGLLYNSVLIVIFFELGGPFLYFNAIVDSYSIIPLDSWLPVNFFSYSAPLWLTLSSVLAKILSLALQLAAPSILAILMAEMFLGIANRLAPQVQIAFLGMPLKSLLGLSLLWAGWFFIVKQMGIESIEWFNHLAQLIHSFEKLH